MPGALHARYRGIPYCRLHYNRAVKGGGDPGVLGAKIGGARTCAHSAGCAADFFARYHGTPYCSVHYERARKTGGDPGRVDRLLGRRGEGSLDANGYRLVFVGGRQRREHTVVMERLRAASWRRVRASIIATASGMTTAQ